MPSPDAATVVGWDIGGAHVKAARLRDGRLVDVAQWACPLWQGLSHLEQVLRAASDRWPDLAAATHAVTMTGEMTDLFAHREDGVRRIAAALSAALGTRLRFFRGDDGWSSAADAGSDWPRIASANWRATAAHAAQTLGDGVLVDIGSTTTDLVVFGDGRVRSTSRSDADRLASGELVYHGVVRTPLCALGPRIDWRGSAVNVMNEFFATSADVYRLTGELEPAHDLQPTADGAAKTLPATRRRLARMVGLDARDASDGDWLDLARAWRDQQVVEIARNLRAVLAAHGVGPDGVAVSAGCGAFLAADALRRAGGHGASKDYGRDVALAGASGRSAGDAGRDGAARNAVRDATSTGSRGAEARVADRSSVSPPSSGPACRDAPSSWSRRQDGCGVPADADARGADGGASAGSDPLARAAGVCAPAVAVAALLDRELR